MRIEFSQKTKELVAKRAAFRCSMPQCGKVTIGPTEDPGAATGMGEAAHIYSASEAGPRGHGSLTAEELASPTNAIWLCGSHARLVDKNRGEDYSASTLLSYRDLHEARIAKELGGMQTRFGWVEEIEVQSSPIFEMQTSIQLGRLTLVVGNNETGKTALCEWIAAAQSPEYLRRWRPLRPERDTVNVLIKYLNPEPHFIRMVFPRNSTYPHYIIDDKLAPIPNTPLRVVYPKALQFRPDIDDLALLSGILNCDPYTVRSLCSCFEIDGSQSVRKAWFETTTKAQAAEDEDLEAGDFLYTDMRGTVPGLPFRALSGSEQIRFVTELAILAARRWAEAGPTVLILDSQSWIFDTSWLVAFGKLLASADVGFQTVASVVKRDVDFQKVSWAGWKVVHLEGKAPNVKLKA